MQGYLRADHGAVYALNNRAGDCTEYMYLVAALCRANGIPTRGVAGYICPSDAVLNATVYHNWAEIYLDGAWQIADAQKRIFRQPTSDYVAMRLIGGSSDSTAGEEHQFRYADTGLKVKMN